MAHQTAVTLIKNFLFLLNCLIVTFNRSKVNIVVVLYSVQYKLIVCYSVIITTIKSIPKKS